MADCPVHDYGKITQLKSIGEKKRRAWAERGVTNIRQLRQALNKGVDLPGLNDKLRRSLQRQLQASDERAVARQTTKHTKPPNVPPPSGPTGGAPGAPVPSTPAEIAVQKYYGQRAFEWFRHNPENRSLSSPFQSTRRTFTRLYTPNLRLTINEVGEALSPSVVARIKVAESQGEFFMENVERVNMEYLLGKPVGGLSKKIGVADRAAATAENVKAVAGRSDKLTKDQFLEAATIAMSRGQRAAENVPIEARPHVEHAAREMRKFYKKFNEVRKANGFESSLDPETYVPLSWRADKIMKDREGFERAIVGSVKKQIQESAITPEAKIEAIAELEANIKGWRESAEQTPHTRIADDLPEYIQANRAKRERTLGKVVVDTEIFRPKLEDVSEYLELNAANLMHRYLKTQVTDVYLKAEFGSIDLADQIAEIRKDADAAISKAHAAGDNETISKLTARRDEDIRDVKALVEILRGTYRPPANPYTAKGYAQRGASLARSLTFMRVGGGFGIASLSDAATIAMHNGVRKTWGGFLAEMGRGMAQVQAEHADADFRAFKLAFTDVMQRRSLSIVDVGDYHHDGITRFEKGVHYATSQFATITGLRPWTNIAKQVAARLTTSRIIDDARAIAAGTASTEALSRFSSGLLTKADATKLVALVDEFGGSENGFSWLGAEKWIDAEPELAERVRAAIVRDVDRSVVTPGIADVPIWMFTHEGKTLLQFRRFGMSHTNRVGVPALQTLQNGDMQVLEGMALSVAMGSMSYMLREITNKREIPTDLSRIIQEGMVRSDLWGAVGELDGLASASTAGLVTARGFLSPDSYYGSRFSADLAGNLLGPNLDTANEIGRSVRALFPFTEDSERDIRALRKVMPLQNLFYVDWLFDAVENGLVNMHTAGRAARRAERDLEAVQ